MHTAADCNNARSAIDGVKESRCCQGTRLVTSGIANTFGQRCRQCRQPLATTRNWAALLSALQHETISHATGRRLELHPTLERLKAWRLRGAVHATRPSSTPGCVQVPAQGNSRRWRRSLRRPSGRLRVGLAYLRRSLRVQTQVRPDDFTFVDGHIFCESSCRSACRSPKDRFWR